jgi:hypothetical protein
MSLVVKPSARERFTPRELIAAYEDFIRSEPQYLDAETGHMATAYLYPSDGPAQTLSALPAVGII